ncbi:MAG: hypothetical protein QOI27_2183 [Gaiellaceae bacterium]|nr:hypothetical protein [Gaiellaceae bacterium]
MRQPASRDVAPGASARPGLDLDAEFWTLEHRPGARPRRLRRDTADSFRRIALAARGVLADLDAGRSGDALLDDGLFRLSGTRLTEIQRLAFISDDAHLERRLSELIDAQDLRALSPARDRRAARALILHAAELGFVPLAAGALEAMRSQPRSARIDLRTVVHVATRWALRRDPLLGRLTVDALTIGATSRPWRPLTLFFEEAVGWHLGRERARTESAELSRLTIQALREGYAVGAGSEAVTNRILRGAETRATIERRVPVIGEGHDARLPWTKALLELEVGSDLPTEASLLAESFNSPYRESA